MTRINLVFALVVLVLAIGGCKSDDSDVTASVAGYRQDADEIVSLERCPVAVQATIQAHLNGGTIREIERTTDHGEVLYEVDVLGADGRVVEFDVAEDGTFRGFEADDDDDDGDDDDDDDEDDD